MRDDDVDGAGRPALMRRLASSVSFAAREASRPARLLLVVKTALAVGLAWTIAPHMPGVVDQYPYYAPLGALVSMYPTLMGSAKSSLQTILGLAAGIALATVIVLTVGPTWWSIPLVVALGVFVSGTGWFGIGKEYVPMAALFVLIIGGHDADDYSLGYLVQMTVGVVIGLVVNLVIAPAPLTAQAEQELEMFRHRLADHLHAIGDAVTDSWPPERKQWADDAVSLAETSRSVRAALVEADESLRGNPRAWRRHEGTDDAHAQLEALDRISQQIRDISETIADTIWDRPGAISLDPALPEPLSAACHAVAGALAIDDREAAEAHRARAHAARAVRALVEAVDDATRSVGRTTGPGVLAAMHLRRILILSRPRTGQSPADAPETEEPRSEDRGLDQ